MARLVCCKCFLGRLYLVNHQRLLHVTLKRENAPSVNVREGVHRELKLGQVRVLKRLLEELAAHILADTVWIQELAQVDRAELQKLLDAGIENDGVISDNLLALGLGELLEEVGVNFSGVVALMEQGPTERTQQIHVQLAEARLGTEEVVLVLLPLVLAARYARQERQDKSSAVQVDDTRLPRFRGLEPALKHSTNQFQIVI